MKIQIICVLLLVILALSCLCCYLWHETERLDHAAQEWAGRAGYSDGLVKVLNQAKAELIVMIRLAYLKGVKDGAR